VNRWWIRCILIVVVVLVLPFESSAPLVYRPGEGWTYETPGEEGKWTRERAEEQLQVAQDAFDQKKYRLAIKAARRTVRVWPLSDYAPEAQFLLARCYEARKIDEKAFREYQNLLKKYPKSDRFDDVLQRQFEIANRFLDGQWFKLWGYIPFFPSMNRTAQMFQDIVDSGPFSDVAPQSQLNIGATREKQSNWFNRMNPFAEAVTAYLVAADRYHDNKPVASEALFKAGLAYFKQARKADYDQSAAGQSIGTFKDFVAFYPDDPRVPEAQRMMNELRTEQARGSFSIARYYEKRRKWRAAAIYFNEAWQKDPRGPYAEQARQKLDTLNKRIIAAAPTAAEPPAGAPTPAEPPPVAPAQ
jgi:outer membrane protein assembly factor BamD